MDSYPFEIHNEYNNINGYRKFEFESGIFWIHSGRVQNRVPTGPNLWRRETASANQTC